MNNVKEQRSFTLLEMLIATAILSILIIFAITGINSAQDVFETGTAVTRGQTAAQRALDQIAFQLMASSVDTISPINPLESTYLRYQLNEDFVAETIVWSDPYQVEFLPDDKEAIAGLWAGNVFLGNNIDDDGDGFVDEGYIRAWQDSPPYDLVMGPEDGLPWTIARNVKMNGLKFTENDETINVSVTILSLDSERRVVESYCDTTITPRN